MARGTIREDEADIRLWVGGVQIGDLWATSSGGVLTTGDTKTRGGNMGSEKSLGGPGTRDDATVTCQTNAVLVNGHKALEKACGKTLAHVEIQYKDSFTGLPVGDAPMRIFGVLKSCSLPNMDNTTQSPGPGMYTVVLSCDEDAG